MTGTASYHCCAFCDVICIEPDNTARTSRRTSEGEKASMTGKRQQPMIHRKSLTYENKNARFCWLPELSGLPGAQIEQPLQQGNIHQRAADQPTKPEHRGQTLAITRKEHLHYKDIGLSLRGMCTVAKRESRRDAAHDQHRRTLIHTHLHRATVDICSWCAVHPGPAPRWVGVVAPSPNPHARQLARQLKCGRQQVRGSTCRDVQSLQRARKQTSANKFEKHTTQSSADVHFAEQPLPSGNLCPRPGSIGCCDRSFGLYRTAA